MFVSKLCSVSVQLFCNYFIIYLYYLSYILYYYLLLLFILFIYLKYRSNYLLSKAHLCHTGFYLGKTLAALHPLWPSFSRKSSHQAALYSKKFSACLRYLKSCSSQQLDTFLKQKLNKISGNKTLVIADH